MDTRFIGYNVIKTYDATTALSTVAASWNAIGPERHVIAEGYKLVMVSGGAVQ